MNVVIDREGCIECGACADTCPKIFVQENGEKARISKEFQQDTPATGSVTDEELIKCIEQAADDCPVDVISTS